MKTFVFVGLLALVALGCRELDVTPVLPEDLNLTANPGASTVELRWNPAVNWWRYADVTIKNPRFVDFERVEIFRSAGDTTRFEKITMTDGREKTFRVTGLPNGELVFFKVIGYLPEVGKRLTGVVAVVPNRIAPPVEVLRADHFKPAAETYHLQEYRVDPPFRYVALERMLNGTRSVWIHNLATRSADQVQWGASKPSWSPDGRKLAFFTQRTLGPDPFDLAVYDLERRTTKALAGVPYLQNLAWSPGGKWIAYQTNRDPGEGTIQLVSTDDGTRATRRVGGSAERIEAFSWLPGGETLLVTTSSGTLTRRDRYRLLRANATGTDEQVLFEADVPVGETAVATDGTIFFVSELPGYRSVWRQNPASGQLTQLTDASGRFTDLGGLHYNEARRTLLMHVWSASGAGRVLVELTP
jgi:hypothetical protein